MFTPRRHSFTPLRLSFTGVQSPRFSFFFRYFGIEAFFWFAFPHRCSFTEVHSNFTVSGQFFSPLLGTTLVVLKRFLYFSVVLHAFSFSPWSYQELVSVAPLRVPWLNHETSISDNVLFLWFPHEARSAAALMQFRVYFTRLGISQLCCSSVLDTSFFVARRFFVFFYFVQ